MNHQNHDDRHGHKHGLMMLLCLIPMAALILLPRLGLELGSLGRLTPYAIFIICPLMHIGMMFMMRDHGKKDQKQEDAQEERRLSEL